MTQERELQELKSKTVPGRAWPWIPLEVCGFYSWLLGRTKVQCFVIF